MTNKKILIEQLKTSSNPLKYIKESGMTDDGKKYIGRLEGPAADFINPTRNGRKYSLELWKKVEQSDDFKEGMQTHTIFGEADHPEERLETSIKEIAVCLREFQIRENEGIVWCAFDILDTPNGRIIKELLDYGSQLGVSSRGSGEEITNAQGETEIDPDTYVFICFDVVIMPAVKSARPDVVESKEYKKLSESVEIEIDNANTVSELNSIKNVVEKAMPSNDSLLESINNKLNNLQSGDNISSEVAKDLEESINKTQELEDTNKKLEKKVSAYNIRITEMSNLIKSMKSNSHNMRNHIKESEDKISQYESYLTESANECNKLVKQKDEVKSQLVDVLEDNDKLSEKLNDLLEENDKLSSQTKQLRSQNRQLESKNKELHNRIHTLQESNSSKLSKLQESLTESHKLNETSLHNLKDENKQLSESLSDMTEQFKTVKDSQSKVLSENKKLHNKCNDLLNGYIKMRASVSGISEQYIRNNVSKNPTVSEIDKVVNEALDKETRLNNIPISMVGAKEIQLLGRNEASEEDVQTMSILESVSNNSND